MLRKMWTYVGNFVVCVCVLSVISVVDSSAMCSSVYGATEPCTFVPAPPGHTPPCARPGETFCERVDQYPMQHIRYLIDKWGYDYSTLFNDESTNDFNSYFSPPDYQYGGYPNTLPSSAGYSYPEPIYIPKPPAGSQYQPPGKQYIPPPLPSNGGNGNYSEFQGYPERRPQRYYQPYQNGIAHGYRGHHNGFQGYGGYNGQQGAPQGQYFDPRMWWRFARDNKNFIRSKRSSSSSISSTSSSSSTPSLSHSPPPSPQSSNKTSNSTFEDSKHGSRSKRQTLGGPQTLCPTNSQYIMPQAALNNKGNWMYVVNQQDQDQRYSQLVKSETCVSQTCSGLCSVPTGYTARCEQRYVQKRLVALEGAGQNLYTDVFWFPSCCVCTFTQG